MTKSYDLPDPRFDLVLERTIEAAPALVWEACTSRDHLMKWFVPLPWTMADVEVDVRPGGASSSSCARPRARRIPTSAVIWRS